MSPAESAALFTHIDALRGDISEIKDDVREVKDLARETNGRVREIERWKAKAEGVLAAASATKPLVVGVLCLLAGGLLEKFVF